MDQQNVLEPLGGVISRFHWYPSSRIFYEKEDVVEGKEEGNNVSDVD